MIAVGMPCCVSTSLAWRALRPRKNWSGASGPCSLRPAHDWGVRWNAKRRSCLSIWKCGLAAFDPGTVVLLADGIDVPLLQALGKPDLFREAWMAIEDFLSLVKSRDGSFRFVFLSGVTNFWALDPFSGFNHGDNLTYEEEWAELLGFTLEEVERCYGSALARASQTLHLPREAIIERMQSAFGGFSFAGSGELRHSVLSPAAVLRFLSRPEEGLEAEATEGAARRILDFLKAQGAVLPRDELILDEEELKEPLATDGFSTLGLLAQAGLLTVRSWEEGCVWLAPPNRLAEKRLAVLR